MRPKDKIYLNFARVFPNSYRNHLASILVYGGEKKNVDYWLGSGTVLALLMMFKIVLIPWVFFGAFQRLYFIIGVIVFLFIEFLVYLFAYFKAEDRTARIEKALPDALQLIAANLKAGMTPYKAIKLSARKEFGPLAEEIDYATSHALGTESFETTLLRISERTNSETLDRALKLFTSAMKSGAHLAKLLEDLGNDISQTRELKNELITSTKTYTAFILFTIMVGTPLLLAISIHFVTIVSEMQEKSNISNVGFGLEFLAGKVVITPDFLTKMSLVMLVLTSLLASMLLGVIKEGKEKQGLRYAPMLIIGCLTVFYVSKYIIGNVFGNLF
ncbi:TPA: type II secretion system F family protein [Candidatus Woesearchaeota archaeon]|nr:type II secretion system F family protein [Candidatus Woesearchaeota archaeon]